MKRDTQYTAVYIDSMVMLSSSLSSPLSFDFFISFPGSTFVSNFSMPSSVLSTSGFIVVVVGGLGLGGSPG